MAGDFRKGGRSKVGDVESRGRWKVGDVDNFISLQIFKNMFKK